MTRIIRERGIDFFDKYKPDGSWRDAEPSDPANSDNESDNNKDTTKAKPKDEDDKRKPMSVQELFDMRNEMIPHL